MKSKMTEAKENCAIGNAIGQFDEIGLAS